VDGLAPPVDPAVCDDVAGAGAGSLLPPHAASAASVVVTTSESAWRARDSIGDPPLRRALGALAPAAQGRFAAALADSSCLRGGPGEARNRPRKALAQARSRRRAVESSRRIG
jgi:hypothetical protein